MEKRAKDFLNLTAKYYEQYREKWEHLLKSIGLKFDEDVYNDTIIKVYDKLMNDPDDINTTEDEAIAYWYQSFVNNIKRNKQYACNSKVDDTDVIDLLKDKAYIVGASHLYYPTIRMLLEKIKAEFGEPSFHLFKMYYLTEYTYDEINDIVGYNAKPKINKIRKWLISTFSKEKQNKYV